MLGACFNEGNFLHSVSIGQKMQSAEHNMRMMKMRMRGKKFNHWFQIEWLLCNVTELMFFFCFLNTDKLVKDTRQSELFFEYV